MLCPSTCACLPPNPPHSLHRFFFFFLSFFFLTRSLSKFAQTVNTSRKSPLPVFVSKGLSVRTGPVQAAVCGIPPGPLPVSQGSRLLLGFVHDVYGYRVHLPKLHVKFNGLGWETQQSTVGRWPFSSPTASRAVFMTEKQAPVVSKHAVFSWRGPLHDSVCCQSRTWLSVCKIPEQLYQSCAWDGSKKGKPKIINDPSVTEA